MIKTNKPKICHITSAHLQRDGRIFFKECSSLAKLEEWDVYLVSYGDSFKENNVNVVGLDIKVASKIERIFVHNRKLVNLAIQIDADVYHIHDPELLLFAKKIKRIGKKVIFDSHENYVEQLRERPDMSNILRKLISCSYKYYQRYIFSRIDGLIFPCSQNGKNPFEGMCKRFEFIDNFPIVNKNHGMALNSKKVDFKVCYVGSLTYNRGVTNIVKACYRAGVPIILAGNFVSQEYKKELQSIEEYACVDYRGVIPADEVGGIYEEASIGVATLLNVGQYGKYDNLSTKVYEYMTYKLPVILSECNYANEINDMYKFGICVNPNDIDAIEQAIHVIKSNSNIAKEMGDNGHSLVLDKFNWDAEGNKLISFYKSILY